MVEPIRRFVHSRPPSFGARFLLYQRNIENLILMDPQTAGGFKAARPMYMKAAICPTPEVVCE
jgi:hypothetical protein